MRLLRRKRGKASDVLPVAVPAVPEAAEERPPIPFYGSWFAAFFDPGGLWRCYKHFTADTLVSKWGLVLPLIMGLFAGGIIGLLLFWLGGKAFLEWAVTSVGVLYAPGFAFAVPLVVDVAWFLLGVMGGVVFGLWLVASLYIYRKVHMLCHVFEFADPSREWHPTSMLILPMPRMAFWRRPEVIFGPAEPGRGDERRGVPGASPRRKHSHDKEPGRD